MILEALVLMDDKIRAKKAFDDLSKDIGSSRWYSTQTTAYALMAIAKFVGTEDVTGSNVKLDFDMNIGGENKAHIQSETPIVQQTISGPDRASGKVTVKTAPPAGASS